MAVTGTFTAPGQSAAFAPHTGQAESSDFNLSLWGTFVGTVVPERSFDGGATWLPVTALANAITFTVPCSEVFSEPEQGVIYRLNCTAFTSGTINYRISN